MPHPVVQTVLVDLYPVDKSLSSGLNVIVGVYFIRWLAIYALDKVIRSLNNRG